MKISGKLFEIVKGILLAVLAILFIFPLILLLVNAFRDTRSIVENPLSFSGTVFLDNFINAFHTMNFPQSLLNSLIVTICSALVVMFFASMLAFFLARFESRFTNVIFYVLIVAMIIPFQAVMVSLVSIYGNLHMLNNMGTLIFFYLGFGLSLTTFMYHGFIKQLPISLEEAAQLDGASMFVIFWKVVFPQLKPITATTFILNVLWFWNDFLLPSLVLIQKSRTLPLTTYTFFGTYTSDYGLAMAGLVLSIVPIIIFYIVMQKNIIGGVTDGAVK